MFQGETAITLDDKGRMAVPTAYRELIASACANRWCSPTTRSSTAACGCSRKVSGNESVIR
jgi:Uncharacterized protein conserved in bacteria